MRIDKPLGNYKEGAIMSLPPAILAVSLDVSNGWTWAAALVTVLSRLTYVHGFCLGIPILRTLIGCPASVSFRFLQSGS